MVNGVKIKEKKANIFCSSTSKKTESDQKSYVSELGTNKNYKLSCKKQALTQISWQKNKMLWALDYRGTQISDI